MSNWRCRNGQVAISKGRDTLPEVRERSGCPPVVSGVVRWPSQRIKTPVRNFGSGWEALPEVREWSGGPLKGSRRPSGILGVVGRTSQRSGSGQEAIQRSGSGREALPEVREWLGDPPKCPAVVESPPQRPGSGRETLTEVREWSGGHPGGLGVVGRTSQKVREWSGGPPGDSGLVGRPSQKTMCGREALP